MTCPGVLHYDETDLSTLTLTDVMKDYLLFIEHFRLPSFYLYLINIPRQILIDVLAFHRLRYSNRH